jgi:hypothetical protein
MGMEKRAFGLRTGKRIYMRREHVLSVRLPANKSTGKLMNLEVYL